MLIVLVAIATLAAPQSAPPARPSPPPARATPTPPSASQTSPAGADDFDFVDNLGRNGMSPEETDRISTSRQQAEDRIQALSDDKKPATGSNNSNGRRQPDQPGRRPPH